MSEERVSCRVEVEGAEGPAVQDFTLIEAISRPYVLEVEVAVSPDTDLPALLGQDLAFTLTRGDQEERLVGLVTQLRVLDQGDPERDPLMTVALRVEPALALLALRRNSRIFQDKKVDEIVQAVLDEALGPYARSAELALDGSYEPREYCVQYEESDLDFVHRLLEEEGIHYAFDHEGAAEVMKLGDRNGAFPEAGSVPFVRDGTQLVEAVRVFRLARRAATTHVQLRDWSFLTASAPVNGEGGADDPDCAGERREYAHEIDRGPTDGMLGTRAGIRAEAHRVEAATCSGVAQSIALRPGRVFELSGCPTLGADGTYLVTEVEHDLRSVGAAESLPGEETYASRFRCVPSALPFRPARVTPRPIIEGVEAATVTGPAGQEIHPDEHGRVKVLFAWDRLGASDETSSCWMRVEQMWAGDGWGFMFIPRIGMEVVVQFVDGNPDRPLITGCVYNGENLPPYALPDEKTKSTFKTESSIGGGGFNEFRFEDLAGSEQIFTHAQKDFDEVVLNDHTTDVGHDQTNTVDGNQVQDIGQNQDETVDKDQKMTVSGHRKVHVKTNFEEKVDGGELRMIVGGSDEEYKDSETRIVTGGVTEVVIGGEKLVVDGDKTEIVLGGQKQIVVGAMTESVTGGASSTTATGMINSLTPSTGTWNAASGLTIKGGAMYNVIAPPSITYTATATYTSNSTVLMQLGAANIGLYAASWGFSWSSVSLGLYGLSVSATGASASATGLSLGLTGGSFSRGGASATATGIRIHIGGMLDYKNALEITI